MATPGKKYKGVRFTTPEGRASYPAVFAPANKFQSEEKEYRIEVLFPKTADLKPFRAACDQALSEVFGNDKDKWPKDDIVYPFNDQAELIEKAQAKEQPTEHLSAGAYFVRFKTSAQNAAPAVVDAIKQPVMEASKLYGGCWVKVSTQIKVNQIPRKDPKTKKPISPIIYVTPYLQAVQIVRDDDSFGGRPRIDDMFQAIENDDNFGNVDPLS